MHKPTLIKSKVPVLLLFLAFFSFNLQSQTVTTTLTSSGSFVVPCGVTQLTIQVWGGGGGGGGGFTGNDDGGGGGGGGGYSFNNAVAVTSGSSYNYTVGAGGNGGAAAGAGGNGGSSIAVFGATTITATGGTGGLGNTTGGATAGGTGGTGNFNGGAGGNGSGTFSGGGGEGASSTVNGVSGSGSTAGTSAANGGDGGAGVTANSASGNAGNNPGGGGSGGTKSSAGGAGGSGRVVITYLTPSAANAGTDQVGCNTSSFALSGNLPAGFTGVWTCITNCTGVSFSNNTSATSNVTGVVANTAATLRWTLTHSSGCTIFDNVVVTNTTTCPLTNDSPCSATPASVNSAYACTVQTAGTIAGATSSTVGLGACGGTADDDVWFSFVANSTTQLISLNNVAGSTTDLYHAVYSGNCGSIGAALLCSDPNSSTISGLTIGNTYFIRIYSWTSTAGQTSTFSLCISPPPTPPSNDNPCGATPATVNSVNACTVQTAGTIAGATSSTVGLGTCGGTADDDVWFSFVANNTTQLISLNNITGSTSDLYHAVYSGNCGSIGAALVCSDPNNSTITGLTVGNTYYIRVYSWTSTTGQTSSFSLCISPPATPPSNDNPCGATPAPVNAVYSCTTQTSGTVNGATSSTVGVGACFGTADDDVWFSFVANNSTQLISLNNVAGSTTDLYHAVYSGNCGSIGAALLCSDPNNSTISGLTVGNTYFIRVYTYTSLTGQTSTFSLCINPPPTPPANDNPCNATSAAVNSAPGTCTVQTAGTIAGATSSGVSTGTCGGTADDDVWFSFVATAATMNLSLNQVNGSTTDLYHSVYAGSCGTPGTAIICSDPNSSNLTGLTIGNTYFIRIYSYTSTTGQTTTFNVCLGPTPPPPSNVSCPQMQPFCSGSAITFQAQAGGGSAAVGPNYGCLGSTPNPTWFYLEIATPGSMAIDLSASSDVDFAMWGPYGSLGSAQAACSSYPAPIDCSYSGSATELLDIASVQVGEVYVVLVTNYADVVQNITLSQATGASATTNCGIVLPIGLTYFHATPDQSRVNVEWETAMENNNDYFEIERSVDALNWATIVQKDGKGNSTSKVKYNYVDEQPYTGVSYYRLKQVDFDKSFKRSGIVTVDLSADFEKIDHVRPNPTKDLIYFDIKAKSKGDAIIELINYAGETVYSEIKSLEYGVNSANLSLVNYRSGVYLLKVKIANSGKTVVYKVVKN